MAAIQLWQDREKRVLDPQLFSTIANDKAQRIGTEERNKNKGTQLRRFFDEVIRLNSQAQRRDLDGTGWNLVHSQLHMLIAKVAYARGRKLVTDSFLNLMRDGINDVKNKEDLKIFTSFLESFMGFYKLHGPN